MGMLKSKQKTQEHLKLQIEDFNARLQNGLLGCYQAKKTFITLADLWTSSRQEVLETLEMVAENIDKHHRNVNLAKLSGITSSITGGAAGIGGLILSPFTGGLSLALSAGGVVGTVAGTATTLGANVAEAYLTKELIEKASKVLETDAFYTKALSAAFREIILHEQNVLEILAELKNETLLDDLERVLRTSSCSDDVKKRFRRLREGANSLEDILVLVKSLYPEDREFLSRLNETNKFFGGAPTVSSTLTSSSEFFQAVKELTTMGPDTLRNISNATLQTTAANNVQVASLSAQLITISLGAVFVALDVYNFIKTSRDYDEGSKTEVAQKMRSISDDLSKEKRQIAQLQDFYYQQVNINMFESL